MTLEDAVLIWQKGLWPLFRLLVGLAFGLLLANLLEALRWTNQLATLTRPLSRIAHLGPVASSAFALAFVSPAAANGLLSENYEKGSLSMRELMLANLFNSLPAYLSHTPTIFLLTWPVLGNAAAIYVGITLLAAILRTVFTIFLGRLLLTLDMFSPQKKVSAAAGPFAKRLKDAMLKAWQRFKKRMPKLVLFTVPVYIFIYAGQECGFFQAAEAFMAGRLDWLVFLKPQVMGIIVMQLVAETGATLGAASAALAGGYLNPRDVVIAMLVGNVLATPLRAIRHQLPAYAGFYRPTIALKLILVNQALRAASMALMILLYVYIL